MVLTRFERNCNPQNAHSRDTIWAKTISTLPAYWGFIRLLRPIPSESFYDTGITGFVHIHIHLQHTRFSGWKLLSHFCLLYTFSAEEFCQFSFSNFFFSTILFSYTFTCIGWPKLSFYRTDDSLEITHFTGKNWSRMHAGGNFWINHMLRFEFPDGYPWIRFIGLLMLSKLVAANRQ